MGFWPNGENEAVKALNQRKKISGSFWPDGENGTAKAPNTRSALGARGKFKNLPL